MPQLSLAPSLIELAGPSTALTAPLAACDLAPFDEAALVEEFAFRFGRNYDAYLVTERGWEYFWGADRRGVVATVRQGRYLFTSGGLLAPEADQDDLLGTLVERANGRGDVLTFFNIAADQLPRFRRHGFQATKWGEEAVIDLPDRTWSGKNFEWVRRQTNYCRRHGLAVQECSPNHMSPAKWHAMLAEISKVSHCFLSGKPQSGEMRFLQGGFDPARLGRKRIFIACAHGGAGRIEGFVACNPTCGGDTWVMETYRQRPDAVRGTIAFLMHHVMQQMRDEGVARVSLCLLPGLHCGTPTPGDSAMVRWGLAMGTGRLNPAFESAGAYHFKSRFRPRFESRYLCARPRMTLGAALAFIRLLGVMHLDFRKLCRVAVDRWQKRGARATLASAE